MFLSNTKPEEVIKRLEEFNNSQESYQNGAMKMTKKEIKDIILKNL